MAYILVVDDEEDLCEILQFNLETDGHDVDVAYSAEEALKLNLKQYDLILLDVMMGEISGFKMAHILRNDEQLCDLPIIFLTARDTENDLLTGFNVGADDYISKPFSVREVMVRVKAVLRRRKGITHEVVEELTHETLRLHLASKKVVLDDQEVALTKKEFQILQLLMSNPNKVLSREEIIRRVWSDEVVVTDRTVDVNITRMRRKIAPYDKNIVARTGYGYAFRT